ncbi:MAG TPA: CTP synthase, partial [Armatimonadetes bacterium]|nr:CTP synthase [Armatimonadota bacterium]
IAIVGKYVKLHDAYLSVAEALRHAGYENGSRIEIKWVDSESITAENVGGLLSDCNGVLIPGGFGNRGIEGKITACRYARENNIPFLGLCLGMQIAVIEFARNVCGLLGANSEEMDEETPHPVIHLLPEQKHVKAKGATMRLGSYPCNLVHGTKAAKLYGAIRIAERHRHRYEVNNDYRETLIQHGMVVSGVSPDYRLVEMIELPSHPFFLGTQAHPEFRSRPNRPHPLFRGLVAAALERRAESASKK